MLCTYLLIDDQGKIVDTLLTTEDVNPKEGEGIVVGGEYYKIQSVDYYIDMDVTPRKIYFIRPSHVPFEELPRYFQTKMIWDMQNTDDV